MLDSQMAGHPANERCYLAAQPSAWIKSHGNHIEIMEKGRVSSFQKNPWEALSGFKNKYQEWMFGYLSYDLKNYVEDLASGNEEKISAPDMFFMIPEIIITIDGNDELNAVKGEIPQHIKFIQKQNNREFSIHPYSQISKEEYVEQINKAKQDIYEGAYYEINLSHPLEFKFEGEAWSLFEAMKEAGPVPFAAYLEVDDLRICCSSPERFLAKNGSKVWSQPIKGTASRNQNPDDEASAEALRTSEKERAENLMIVDLVRNDLGRIAKNKSVKVSKLFEIQSFETVHQMVSTVECDVDDKTSSIEIIKACFPMGSMTGAPKIAAMQAIEKYENYKRGVYSGAMGYFKPNGDFDFNVVIRTAIINGDKLIYPVGGAITSDSDAEAEWVETLVKARALTNISNDFKKPE